MRLLLLLSVVCSSFVSGVLCGLRYAASDRRLYRFPCPVSSPLVLCRLTPVSGVCRVRLLTRSLAALRDFACLAQFPRLLRAPMVKRVAAGYLVC